MRINKSVSFIIVFVMIVSNISVFVGNNDDDNTDKLLELQKEMLKETKTGNYIIKYKDKEKSKQKLLKSKN